MATFVKTDAGKWKAIIRKQGWPITSKTSMLGWIVRIAIETGMRQSEILNFRKSKVDMTARVVRLADT